MSGCQAGDVCDGCLRRQPGRQGEPQGVVHQGHVWAQQHADVESIVRGGVPAMAAASSAGGLLVGDPYAAVSRAGLRRFEREQVGRWYGGSDASDRENWVPARRRFNGRLDRRLGASCPALSRCLR